jgi:NAD(P)-dependent dehydrogenase (short-subunit alcohol dehydrogenase family)
VIVKNFGVAGKFDVYDNSKVREELLSAGALEIEIPALDGSVYQSVDRSSLSFTTFVGRCSETFGYTERRYCRILVNNAGMNDPADGPSPTARLDGVERVLRTNFLGAPAVTQAKLALRKSQAARIVTCPAGSALLPRMATRRIPAPPPS